MKIEAVIFDWAGTTVDYGCFAPVQAFMEIFKQYGIEVTMDETRKPMGMLKWDHIKTMLQMPTIQAQWKTLYGRESNDQDVDEMHALFTEKLMAILHQFVDVKPFVMDAVDELRSMKIKIGSTTGYTDEMMEIVVREAKKNGYAPDFWITPNSVGNFGRPYPYMIFENMKALQVSDVHHVIKVGDTISDIKEGVHAGVMSVGVLEGSSLMALKQEEYEALDKEEKAVLLDTLRKQYKEAGADHVILNLKELPALIKRL
ncbi:phosphonoacetaldehyde hydrolase [[Eubacterium] hominis]|uniref:phosphonoacetaldehyde hydrolase n=1 Tax=[Eubacterium] hominis TaxID=2764325 RepID=UPI003A4E1B36